MELRINGRHKSVPEFIWKSFETMTYIPASYWMIFQQKTNSVKYVQLELDFRPKLFYTSIFYKDFLWIYINIFVVKNHGNYCCIKI